MIKQMRLFALPLALLLTLAGAAVASAHEWRAFEFTSPGQYEFHVQTIRHFSWMDPWELESEHFYTIAVRPTDTFAPDGERILDVTTAEHHHLTESRLRQSFGFGMLAFDDYLIFGEPFEFTVLLQALPDMDFEVGQRISVPGLGRVSIVEEETVAGRTGLVVRYEEGDASDRRVRLEWTIDDKLSLPLAVRKCLILQTMLIKYEDI